jgi:hypothetical protein
MQLPSSAHAHMLCSNHATAPRRTCRVGRDVGGARQRGHKAAAAATKARAVRRRGPVVVAHARGALWGAERVGLHWLRSGEVRSWQCDQRC